MEQRLVKIGVAAKLLGTTPPTLRKWERTGELLPARKTRAGTRYCAVADLLAIKDEGAPTIAYARVSSHDRKADLDRRREVLEAYCAAKGWRTQVIRDLGSGMNCNKRGLQQPLEMILRRRMNRLVLTSKDRLLRFDAELVFSLCETQGIDAVIIHKGERPSFEEELANDVLEISGAFSVRLYGSRSRKSKKTLDALTDDEKNETANRLSVL